MAIKSQLRRLWRTALCLLLLMWLRLWRICLACVDPHRARRAPHGPRSRVTPLAAGAFHRARRKPAWVLRQLILLKAHMPQAGCRLLAITFNRVFAHHEVSLSKSFVHRALRDQAYAVMQARKAIRLARPRAVAVNACWGLDLTGRQDGAGVVHTILGLLDHGSRRVLALKAIALKSGWHLLGHLCFAIAEFGRPRSVRTDNEACFTGRVFASGLRLLGIGHQRIDLHCPWQNGRIERFFGTLKPYLKQWQFDGALALDLSLAEFGNWYNAIRPHQNLDGRTPLEAWNNVDPFHAPCPPKSVEFVQNWDGLLAGFHIRR